MPPIWTFDNFRELHPNEDFSRLLYGSTVTVDVFPKALYEDLTKAVLAHLRRIPGYQTTSGEHSNRDHYVAVGQPYGPADTYYQIISGREVAEWLTYGKEYYPFSLARRIAETLLKQALGEEPKPDLHKP